MTKSSKLPMWAMFAIMGVVSVIAGVVVFYITNPKEAKEIGLPSKTK